MVIHYECEYCGTPFVPISEAPKCPQCGGKSDELFPELIDNMLESVQCELIHPTWHYDMKVKEWGARVVGFFYIHMAFLFFDYARSRLKGDKWDFLFQTLAKDKADELATKFLSKSQLLPESQPYWKHGLQTYLSLFLQRAPTSPDPSEDFIVKDFKRDEAVFLSKRGLIYKMPAQYYISRYCARYGAGRSLVRNANDETRLLVAANIDDDILFFTNKGRAFCHKCCEIPSSGLSTPDMVAANSLFPIDENEKVIAMVVECTPLELDQGISYS